MHDLPPTIDSPTASSKKLAGLLESILQQIEQGESVDIEALKKQHPDIALQLEQCFQNLQFIEGAAGLLESSVPAVDGEQASQQKLPFGEIGDFRIVRQLGRGGMGVVYEAEQLSLRRKVALKVLPFATLSDQRAMQRFKNEVAAVASLDHPHIVDVYAVACDKGVHHYAMRLIRGSSVAQILERIRGQDDESRWTIAASSLRGSSPNPGVMSTQKARAATTKAQSTNYFDAVARFGESIAEALDYAHEHGVIHRDVKPANLMIDDEGKAWITDFGLAQMATGTQLTMTGDLLGTALYMSPEQLMAKRIAVDHRTDIYSLGVTLYEMLTLVPPLKSDNRQELFRQIMLDEPKPPRKHNAFIPEDLETIVLKAIEKNPVERYASAQDLADELQRFRQHEPIRARRATIIQKTIKWTVRHQAVTWAVMLTMLGVSIVSTVAGAMIATTNSRLTTANKELVHQTNLAARREKEARAAEADARSAETIVERGKKETELQRDLATGNLYLAHMRQAQQDWDNGQVTRLHELLEGYIPEPGQRDLRCWEWYYFLSLCYQDLQALSGHMRGTFSVSWNPDGTLLASGSADRTIKIWNVANGKELRTLSGHVQGVQSVAWSPDAKHIVSGSSNGAVKLWKADTDEEPATLREIGPPVTKVAWRPDGQFVCWGEKGEPGKFAIWSLQRGLQLSHTAVDLENHREGVEAIAWSPDGGLLAIGCGCTLTIWDVEAEKEVRSWKAHEHDLWTLAWSPSGDRLASGAYDRPVKLWKTDSWEESFNLSHQSGVSSVDWSPDGTKIAVGTWGQEVRIWDAHKGMELKTFRGHSGSVHAVAWSPDGLRIASGSEDRTIKIWDAASMGNGSEATSQPSRLTEYSPDRKYRITWDRSSSNRRIAIHNSVSTDEAVLKTGVTENELISWHPSGKRVAIPFEDTAGGWDRTVRVWNTSSGSELLVLRGHTGAVWDVDWSPDGSRIASREQDGQTIKLWDAQTGQEILTLTSSGEGKLQWSDDGRQLLSGTTIFDASRGFEIFTSPTFASAKAWRYFDRAQELALSGRYDDAGDTYKRALSNNPLLESSEGGLKDFESAARFQFGFRLMNNGELEAAIHAFRETVALNPKHSAAYFNLGRALTENGQLYAAIEAYGKGAELEPNFGGFHNGMGVALGRNGQFEAGIAALSKAIELSPTRPKFHNDLAWLLATCPEPQFQNPKKAILLAERATELAPTVSSFWNTLGVSRYRAENYQAAADAVEKSIELSKEGTGFDFFILAMAYRQLGDQERARDCYSKAEAWMQRHKPDDQELQRFRAEAIEVLGR